MLSSFPLSRLVGRRSVTEFRDMSMVVVSSIDPWPPCESSSHTGPADGWDMTEQSPCHVPNGAHVGLVSLYLRKSCGLRWCIPQATAGFSAAILT